MGHTNEYSLILDCSELGRAFVLQLMNVRLKILYIHIALALV